MTIATIKPGVFSLKGKGKLVVVKRSARETISSIMTGNAVLSEIHDMLKHIGLIDLSVALNTGIGIESNSKTVLGVAVAAGEGTAISLVLMSFE